MRSPMTLVHYQHYQRSNKTRSEDVKMSTRNLKQITQKNVMLIKYDGIIVIVVGIF